ncbi:MAG TPA: rhomboid family intramembrane serine protease [Candidatus Acidoferrum sp.]|nr:rhomboid family intramembrane serine protease [Candidatus Acidoferrum sp.]
MRAIGYLADETAARTFGDYLYVQGIENQVEHHQPEGWAVWVSDEDKIEQAAKLLAAFRQNPADPKYRTEGKAAAEMRDKENKGAAAYRKKVRERRHLFRPLAQYGFGPLTFVLIAISVVVAIYSRLGSDPQAIMRLFMTDFNIQGSYLAWNPTLPEIRHGEIWRLLTPIFIHFGALHLIFNMLWLRDLGSMIEGRQSPWVLALLVVVIGVASNLAQFYYGGPHLHYGGPDFGGMSGVVYGLLGYIWIRGKFDPGSGLYVHTYTVTMMIVWFFACFTPLIPHVANGTHAAGLLMGTAWGYLSSLRYR